MQHTYKRDQRGISYNNTLKEIYILYTTANNLILSIGNVQMRNSLIASIDRDSIKNVFTSFESRYPSGYIILRNIISPYGYYLTVNWHIWRNIIIHEFPEIMGNQDV